MFGLWWFRIFGTVIPEIWWQVVMVTIYTAIVVSLHQVAEWKWLEFPMSLSPIIGVVVGLLLAFKTESAYDRYWEGRKIWTTMTVQVRTLARSIWLGVKGYESKDLIEKKSAINLAVAFVTATKHYLREEYDYDYEDLVSLIGHMPRLSTPGSTVPLEMQTTSMENLAAEAVSAKKRVHHSRALLAYEAIVPSNIPIEISHNILSYIYYVQDNNLTESFIIDAMSNSLNSMVDCLTNFERLIRTPIPLAYSIHLHHCVWLYILSLPYELVGSLHWWSIQIVAIGSFCLLGILSIGATYFGYDDNDLPLDDFCTVIRREVNLITDHPPPDPRTWLHSPKNHPFGSSCDTNAVELAKMPVHELRKMFHEYSGAEDHTHL